ncbi:MAG: NAD(P)/FAD-dependent oxidoreductase, partial [Wolinella sp.]
NLIDVMEGHEPSAQHNGYTVCPILTNYGKVLLAEFGYDNVLLPSLPLLEPAQERWMWWVMKRYILHPLYYYGMLKGIA